ncbi:MAG: luciferase family oxidoreductase, partial [Burkholderiales bacterium 12-64-5]
ERAETADDFPRDVAELQHLLAPALPGQRLIATPGAGTNVPIWLLGSSLFSAQLAAERGLPYAFASHFAPRLLLQALTLYRQNFQPSATLAKPYVLIGVPLIAAPTDEEAEYLASSTRQRVLGILRGDRRALQPPMAQFSAQLQPQERAAINDFLAAAVIGGPETVQQGLSALAQATGADEFMLVCDVFDPALRLRSLDIAAAARAA